MLCYAIRASLSFFSSLTSSHAYECFREWRYCSEGFAIITSKDFETTFCILLYETIVATTDLAFEVYVDVLLYDLDEMLLLIATI